MTGNPPHGAAPFRPRRRAARVLRFIAPPLCIAAVIWLFRSLDLREVARLTRDSDHRWLALSFAAMIGRYGIWGLKSGRMFRRQAPFPTGAAVRGVVAGAFVNLVTPTAKVAGGLYRAAKVRAITGWRVSTSYGWIVADQFTNGLGSTLFFGAIAISAGTGLGGPGGKSLTAIGVASLLSVVLFVIGRDTLWGAVRRPRMRRLLSKLSLVRSTRSESDPDQRSWFEAWLSPLLEGPGGTRALVEDIAAGTVSLACFALANAAAFRAIGVDAPLAEVTVILTLGTLAGGVVGMGGVGVTEAALVGLYAGFGISRPEAAAATLMHRFVLYAVVVGWGGWALWRSRSPNTRTPAGAPQAGVDG